MPTIEELDAQVREVYARTGKRPMSSTHRVLVAGYRHHKISLSVRCTELGLPGGTNHYRTQETIDAALRAFFATHNRRPTSDTSRIEDAWLRKRKSSVAQRCIELGIPESPRESIHSFETVDAAILAHWKETGTRPGVLDFPHLYQWLYREGTSLGERCDFLGLPAKDVKRRIQPRPAKEGELEALDAALLALWKKNGKRPKAESHRDLSYRLERIGTTVAQRCNALGIPGGYRPRSGAGPLPQSQPSS